MSDQLLMAIRLANKNADECEKLETALRDLLEAYIEENGGDMPTNDSHPAHTARKLLEKV